MYISVKRDSTPDELPTTAFAARSQQVSEIAATLQLSTPDPYIDAAAAAIGIAADALWDAGQQCVMHGGVAWRNPLAGWRGPYCLSSLGQQARMRQQVRHWSSARTPRPSPIRTSRHRPRRRRNPPDTQGSPAAFERRPLRESL